MRAARDVEIDARRGDRAGEPVERDAAEDACVADVAAVVVAAEREVDLRCDAAGLADELAHPLAAELVGVAVKKDVHLLLDRLRSEELRVDGPEDRLGPARAELAQPLERALGVRHDEVVLGGVGAHVVVEAAHVGAPELGQRHRRVAVVEHDGNAEALAQRGRDAAEVRHRDREDDDRVHAAFALDQPL